MTAKSGSSEIVDIVKRASHDNTSPTKINSKLFNQIKPFYDHMNKKSARRLIDLLQETQNIRKSQNVI